ncbi:hypothetical protein BHM03_00021131 [Ensete ventricosum]|nr:hypothetical protein BHM03_00021131 [Ensete ventricosum]
MKKLPANDGSRRQFFDYQRWIARAKNRPRATDSTRELGKSSARGNQLGDAEADSAPWDASPAAKTPQYDEAKQSKDKKMRTTWRSGKEDALGNAMAEISFLPLSLSSPPQVRNEAQKNRDRPSLAILN